MSSPALVLRPVRGAALFVLWKRARQTYFYLLAVFPVQLLVFVALTVCEYRSMFPESHLYHMM